MFDEEYELMYQTEERHWWFSVKRAIVFDQIERHMPENSARPRILDVGIGTGIVLVEHARRGRAFGVDLSSKAIAAAMKRNSGARIVRASALSIPFAGDSFDIVTCLDVLYHKNISSDFDALQEIHRVMKPGGLFVMTDSALRCLWSKHDVVMESARRYHRAELEDLISSTGLVPLKVSYMNFFLLPLVYAKRKIDKWIPGPPRSDVGDVNPVINSAFRRVYGFEKTLLRHMNLPLGSSVLAIARKPRQQ